MQLCRLSSEPLFLVNAHVFPQLVAPAFCSDFKVSSSIRHNPGDVIKVIFSDFRKLHPKPRYTTLSTGVVLPVTPVSWTLGVKSVEWPFKTAFFCFFSWRRGDETLLTPTNSELCSQTDVVIWELTRSYFWLFALKHINNRSINQEDNQHFNLQWKSLVGVQNELHLNQLQQ